MKLNDTYGAQPCAETAPFLRYVAQLDEQKLPDDWAIARGLTAGDFRAVARALGVLGTPETSDGGQSNE